MHSSPEVISQYSSSTKYLNKPNLSSPNANIAVFGTHNDRIIPVITLKRFIKWPKIKINYKGVLGILYNNYEIESSNIYFTCRIKWAVLTCNTTCVHYSEWSTLNEGIWLLRLLDSGIYIFIQFSHRYKTIASIDICKYVDTAMDKYPIIIKVIRMR